MKQRSSLTRQAFRSGQRSGKTEERAWGGTMRPFLTLMFMAPLFLGNLSAPPAVAKNNITGKCDCKDHGGKTLKTYSKKECLTNNSSACATVKAACVQANQTTCVNNDGGEKVKASSQSCVASRSTC